MNTEESESSFDISPYANRPSGYGFKICRSESKTRHLKRTRYLTQVEKYLEDVSIKSKFFSADSSFSHFDSDHGYTPKSLNTAYNAIKFFRPIGLSKKSSTNTNASCVNEDIIVVDKPSEVSSSFSTEISRDSVYNLCLKCADSIFQKTNEITNFEQPSINTIFENVSKTCGDSKHALVYIYKVIEILTDERLSFLSSVQRSDMLAVRENSRSKNANFFKAALNIAQMTLKLSSSTLHSLFITHLPKDLLVQYLCLLKTLNAEEPHSVQNIIKVEGSETAQHIHKLINELLNDPAQSLCDIITEEKDKPEKIRTPIADFEPEIIFLSPVFYVAGENHAHKFSRHMSFMKTLAKRFQCEVNYVKMPPIKKGQRISDYDMKLRKHARAKLDESKQTGRPIILCSWGVTCWLALEMALEYDLVSVCFGFDTLTIHGTLEYMHEKKVDTPTLFVIGDDPDCSIEQIDETLATISNNKIGLILVYHADKYLKILKNAILSLNQEFLDVRIIRQVENFLVECLEEKKNDSSMNEIGKKSLRSVIDVDKMLNGQKNSEYKTET